MPIPRSLGGIGQLWLAPSCPLFLLNTLFMIPYSSSIPSSPMPMLLAKNPLTSPDILPSRTPSICPTSPSLRLSDIPLLLQKCSSATALSSTFLSAACSIVSTDSRNWSRISLNLLILRSSAELRRLFSFRLVRRPGPDLIWLSSARVATMLSNRSLISCCTGLSFLDTGSMTT